jgi:large subunit ribosomal protein L27
MGRDHTIFAREKGYVVFYRDPELHAKRKYIGVVFERGEVLPRSRLRPRRRRLGLVGREREGVVGEEEGEGTFTVEEGGNDEARETDVRQLAKSQKAKGMEVPKLELRPGYQYRESNWHIGRAAERADIKVREYKRGDRFLAWRKLNARKARNAERRALSSRKKKGNARRR